MKNLLLYIMYRLQLDLVLKWTQINRKRKEAGQILLIIKFKTKLTFQIKVFELKLILQHIMEFKFYL